MATISEYYTTAGNPNIGNTLAKQLVTALLEYIRVQSQTTVSIKHQKCAMLTKNPILAQTYLCKPMKPYFFKVWDTSQLYCSRCEYPVVLPWAHVND